MPVTRNIRIRNAHTTLSNPPQLPCTFEGCLRFFKSSKGLRQHIRAHHRQHDFGHDISPEPTTPTPPEHSTSLSCPIAGCERSFINRAGLTQHMRTFHAHQGEGGAPGSTPSSIPSPRSSPFPYPMEEDEPFQNNMGGAGDNQVNDEGGRHGDEYEDDIDGWGGHRDVWGAPSEHQPTSPAASEHQHAGPAPAERQRTNPPPGGLKRTDHHSING
jgi:Zinc finger, C2H2 type